MAWGAPWQWVATALVVGGAVLYLIWKLIVAPRLTAGRKGNGPDVPVERLTKKKDR